MIFFPPYSLSNQFHNPVLDAYTFMARVVQVQIISGQRVHKCIVYVLGFENVVVANQVTGVEWMVEEDIIFLE